MIERSQLENARFPSQAALALMAIALAASLGIVARLYLPDWLGQSIFVATRLFMLALPIVWFFKVEKRQFKLPSPSQAELWTGFGVGLLMFAIILAAYWIVGRPLIDPIQVRTQAAQIGLSQPSLFLAGALYFTFVNALIEEYLWRWFVYRQCEVFVKGVGAIALAAFCFMLHHSIQLAYYTGNVWVIGSGSFGVWLAGAVWCALYLKFRSVWGCYFSHVLADSALALVGWHLLFGSL